MTTLTLLRGLPGSGKSTLAKKMKSFAMEHFEADMFFMKDGVYRFDPNQLADAHDWCRSETEECLYHGKDVIVSNTFTTMREMKPYIEMANRYKATVAIYLCQGQFGSIHNVPDEAMQRMKARFVYDISPLFNKVETHES